MDDSEILPQITPEGQEPPSVIFQDLGVMNFKANMYREAGWVVLSCDNPERGIIGWTIFREAIDNQAEAIAFQYYSFGKQLVPNIIVLKTGPEFLAELEPRLTSKLIDSCDNIELRQVGFVSYEKAESDGVALVFRIYITDIKQDVEFRDKLLAAVRRIQRNHPFNDQ